MAALSRLSDTHQNPLSGLILLEKVAGLPTVCCFDPPVNIAFVDSRRYYVRFTKGRCFDY